MFAEQLKRWRKSERERLLAARLALAPEVVQAHRLRIDAHLARAFPQLARMRVGLCWPIRNEYDARHFARTLRERGALTALPVVVAPGEPLIFREWHPGVRLRAGALDIAYPLDSPQLVPEALLVPMNGWDGAGHRLGYGAGFFDRTLASLAPRPIAIGIAYEMARLETIHPQPWDLPLDWVVTERGTYRRGAGGLEFEG
jgi:5,10-methenyltetrahydrofolate synthetase